ncbi:MAG: hypothetical protein ABS934_06160 [Psychrobacillus sp.]
MSRIYDNLSIDYDNNQLDYYSQRLLYYNPDPALPAEPNLR